MIEIKAVGFSPSRSGGKNFFSRVSFLCWLIFRYSFHPRDTAQNADGWFQLAPYAPYMCGFGRLYGVHTTCAETSAVSRGSSHVTTKQRCKYTTWMDIQKATAVTLLRINCNKSAMSLLENGEQRSIKHWHVYILPRTLFVTVAWLADEKAKGFLKLLGFFVLFFLP